VRAESMACGKYERLPKGVRLIALRDPIRGHLDRAIA
jgi:hypothetical protein